MAKKTVARSKTPPKAEAAEVSTPASKPKARTRTTKPTTKKVVASAPGATAVSAPAEPSDEDIRVRAYHRYLERGGGHGMDFEDWLEAKRELQKA